MSKCWVYSLPNGRAAIIRIVGKPSNYIGTASEWEAYALAKTCFELTRPKDAQGRIINPNEHFNAGTPAHITRGNALVLVAMTDADVNAPRTRRNDWIIQGNRVVVSPTPLPDRDAGA